MLNRGFEIAGGQIDGARDYQEDAYLTTYIDDQDAGPKSAALVVMAKHPAPGEVKTRMCPPLTLGDLQVSLDPLLVPVQRVSVFAALDVDMGRHVN